MDLNQIPTRSERELYIKDKCIELLDNFGKNPKEHMFQLSKFVATEMDQDYKPLFFKESMPELLSEYVSLGASQKLEFDKKFPEWRKNEEVQNYNDKKNWTEKNNESNKGFLKECLEALEGTQEAKLISGMLGRYTVTKKPVEQTIDWHN